LKSIYGWNRTFNRRSATRTVSVQVRGLKPTATIASSLREGEGAVRFLKNRGELVSMRQPCPFTGTTLTLPFTGPIVRLQNFL